MPSYDACVGEIQLWAANFAPYNWAFCQGQILPIAQNTALFSLIYNYYGGDGVRTFALPDLRGRFALGASPDPVRELYVGQSGGSASSVLTSINVPAPADPPLQTALTPPVSGQIGTLPPYLVVNYIICLNGVYPQRS